MFKWFIALCLALVVMGCGTGETAEAPASPEGEPVRPEKEAVPPVVATQVVFFDLQDGTDSVSQAELIDSVVARLHGHYAWPARDGGIQLSDTLPAEWKAEDGPVMKFFSTSRVTALRFRDSKKVRVRFLENLPFGRTQIDTDIYANRSNQWLKTGDPGIFRLPSDVAWEENPVLPEPDELCADLVELIVLIAYK